MYADVLFLIDFSMDTLVIWFASRLLYFKVTTLRVVLAATFGAVFSTALIVSSTDAVLSTVFGITSPAVMVLIVFGRSGIGAFLKRFAVLWTVGMLLGGIMTYVLSFGNGVIYPNESSTQHNPSSPLGILPLGVLLCAFLVFSLSRAKVKKEVKLKISFNGKTTHLRGMIDSGNLLRDAITGEPVIVASERSLTDILTENEINLLKKGTFDTDAMHLQARYRFVVADTVVGSKVIPCIRVDEIILAGKKCRALIGLCENVEKSTDCIVPDVLV